MRNNVPIIDYYKNKRLAKFLILQYFIFVFICQLSPKNLMQRVFVIEILLFTLIFLKHFREMYRIIKKGGIVNKMPLIFFLFLLVAIIYLVLSFMGMAESWNIENLPFDQSYIPRHFMIIAELMIPVGLGYLLYKSDILYRIKNSWLIIFSILSFSIRFFDVNPLPYAAFFVASVSLYAFQTKKVWLMPITFFALSSHAAYLLASLFVCLLVFFRKTILLNFRKETTFKVYVLLMLIAVFIVLFSVEIYDIIAKDENSLWRLMVWQNEINSLRETYFTGVGFGSAYVTSDIFMEVNNYNMYIGDPDATLYERLFVVANHNSFLNMFYRMGIIGGGLFFSIYVLLVKWSLCLYSAVRDYMKPYIWWAFCGFMYQTIIILLNPGLEMMQFAMNFCMVTAILIAVLLRAQKDISVNNK